VPAPKRSFLSKALFAFNEIKPLPPITRTVVAPEPGPTAEYGKYLANNLAGCADCHTPRNLQDGTFYLDSLFAGSSFAFGGVEEEPLLAYAPNITPDENTGIGRWTEDQFITTLRTGVRPDSTVLSLHMPYAYYGLWNMDDLKAVYRYLKTVPAVKRTVPPVEYSPEASKASGVARGKIIFLSHCVSCHGTNGAGAAPTNTILAELAPSMDDITLKEFIRDGQIELRMPGFKKTLTTDELNDLVRFIRSWNTVASTN
jgi:mono/diheme cytochrome c family protein